MEYIYFIFPSKERCSQTTVSIGKKHNSLKKKEQNEKEE